MIRRTSRLVCRVMPAALLFVWFVHGGHAQAPQPTSETNPRLREALARFPDADADGDGVLTMAEARAYLAERRPGGQRKGGARTAPKASEKRNQREVDLSKIEKSGNGLWVASTGHSLVAPALGPFEAAAKAAGFEGHLQVRQISGGATGSPRAHWEKPEEQQTVKRALATGKCDVLTMGTHYEGSEVEDFARWIDLGLAHNPKMVFYVQDAWPYLDELLDTRSGKTDDRQATLDRYRNAMDGINSWIGGGVEQLDAKYPGKVHVIPIGNAMLELVRRQLAGQLPGVDCVFVPGKKDQKDPDGRVGLYRDQIHPTEPVAALEGYLYFACLYKKNPADLPQALYKDPQLDRVLREVAWKTVLEHPWTGVKPPE